jgi:prepilin-type N-terminal cleavage/methylation domain-containing protein
MLLRSGGGHRRTGYTLIELLVVIAIIAVLMSLIAAGVMRALDLGPRAETTARIAAINNGINTFKSNSQFGQVKYIPAGRPDMSGGPFRLRNSYTSTSNPDMFSPEAQYITQVFGTGTNLANLGGGVPDADLDANQTLTFFLCGITEVDGQGNANFAGFANGQQPFTPRASPTDARRGPTLDLGGRRKYVLGGPNNRFASMIDGYGTPFAYFVAFNGLPNRYYGLNAGGPYGSPTNGAGVIPYGTGAGAARKYENEAGYQIISAGKDKLFGRSGAWPATDREGQDDQANFSPNLLGAPR